MAHYFTRQEAEALLPQITVILRNIQATRKQVSATQDGLEALHVRAMSNGHSLHEHTTRIQKDLVEHIQLLNALVEELLAFGCELKDPDTGLIDFLSLRAGKEVYLCWLLGEDRIRYWHDLHTGFAGRQPL